MIGLHNRSIDDRHISIAFAGGTPFLAIEFVPGKYRALGIGRGLD